MKYVVCVTPEKIKNYAYSRYYYFREAPSAKEAEDSTFRPTNDTKRGYRRPGPDAVSWGDRTSVSKVEVIKVGEFPKWERGHKGRGRLDALKPTAKALVL